MNTPSTSNQQAIKGLAKTSKPVATMPETETNAEAFQQVLSKQLNNQNKPNENKLSDNKPSDNKLSTSALNPEESQQLIAEIEGRQDAREQNPDNVLQSLVWVQQLVDAGFKTSGNIELQNQETIVNQGLPTALALGTEIRNPDMNKSISASAENEMHTFNQRLSTMLQNNVGTTPLPSDASSNQALNTLAKPESSEATLQHDAFSQLVEMQIDGQENQEKQGLNFSTKYESAPSNIQINPVVDMTKPQNTQVVASTNINPITAPIMEYPGKSGWDQAIGQRVLMMVNNAQQSASISLNPPELGPLEIVIEVSNAQTDTTFLSDRQEVRQALQDGLENLRSMMKESGISLGNTNIGARQQQDQANTSGHQAQSGKNGLLPKEPQAPMSTAQMLSQVRVALGGVDTFV